VVMLSAVSGLSNNEIQEVTGLSDDNVRVLLSRGRKKLKQLFANFLKDGHKG
ncbi:MAG: RNA polymerase subunit sigma-70, partial [Muribaculaceae bacterium]|nr:RNA polymerase subunit sigma-70 [Muribaculaceae bacterium]